MNTIRVNNIYFSPKFLTQKTVETVGNELSNDVNNIDLSLNDKDYSIYKFNNKDICVVGVPSFAGRVPKVALERLNQLSAQNTPTIIITTYGNRAYEDTLIELKDTLSKNGFRVLAAMAIVCQHSIINEFAKNRPNEEDIKQIKEYTAKIKEKIENNNIDEVNVPGNHPYKEYKVTLMLPKTDKGCVKCQKCAKACPVGAIPLDEPDKTDKDKCISCMRCIEVCENNKRSLNKVMLMAIKSKLKKVCSDRKENELFI